MSGSARVISGFTPRKTSVFGLMAIPKSITCGTSIGKCFANWKSKENTFKTKGKMWNSYQNVKKHPFYSKSLTITRSAKVFMQIWIQKYGKTRRLSRFELASRESSFRSHLYLWLKKSKFVNIPLWPFRNFFGVVSRIISKRVTWIRLTDESDNTLQDQWNVLINYKCLDSKEGGTLLNAQHFPKSVSIGLNSSLQLVISSFHMHFKSMSAQGCEAFGN